MDNANRISGIQNLSFGKKISSAVGTPRAIFQKFHAVYKMLKYDVDQTLRESRMEILYQKGIIKQKPTIFQIWVGRWVMAKRYHYRGRMSGRHSINQNIFLFSILQILDAPATAMISGEDGLVASKRGLVSHLLKIAHYNPTYDLQLLLIWDDGISCLQNELEQVLNGKHPRQEFIVNTVDRSDYHRVLFAALPQFLENPQTNLQLYEWPSSEVQSSVEIFGTVTGFMEYCCKLPKKPLELIFARLP